MRRPAAPKVLTRGAAALGGGLVIGVVGQTVGGGWRVWVPVAVAYLGGWAAAQLQGPAPADDSTAPAGTRWRCRRGWHRWAVEFRGLHTTGFRNGTFRHVWYRCERCPASRDDWERVP